MDDLYSVLGVPRTATASQIKKAYRELSKVHHPDAGGDAVRFGQISRAYKVLKDSKLRQKYDATGDVDDGVDNSLGIVIAQAANLVHSVIARALELNQDPEQCDLVEAAIALGQKRLAEFDKAIIAVPAQAVKARAVAKRFSAKKGKTNYLTAVLEAHAADLEAMYAKNVAKRKVLVAAIDLLKDHSFASEVYKARSNAMLKVGDTVFFGFEFR